MKDENSIPQNSPNEKPIRIQRKRQKGWRMPENTEYVGRPGPFGNPFHCMPTTQDRQRAVDLFDLLLANNDTPAATKILSGIHKLKGKNLACWCSLDQPCHADVLLRVANEVKRHEDDEDK